MKQEYFFTRLSLGVLVLCFSFTIQMHEVAAAVKKPVVAKKVSVPILDGFADGYPMKNGDFAAAIIVDVHSGKILYQYMPDKVWPAASLSKLTTALVVLDRKPSWNKIVKMSSKDEVGGARLRVSAGSKLSVKDLFFSSLVGSANNATMALSRQTGLTQKEFVSKMNKKVKDLGLKKTVFYEPTGMNENNVTTANEMAKIAKIAFSSPDIKRAGTTVTYTLTPRGTTRVHTIKNTDKLIEGAPELGIMGGKTGYLIEAQYNFATMVQPLAPLEKEPPLVVVVLGAPSMTKSFASARALANWAWKAYSWPSLK